MQTQTESSKNSQNRPLVSICCETYNHAKFVRDALEGFIMQKTDFAFEILIHDDASTDGTQEIIKEYCEKYPDLFKPIFQTENQHSKGVKIWGDIQFPRAQGKYIALCEGDDYWTVPNKLQRQIDFLESHPGYTLCFHNAWMHYENDADTDHLFTKLETREYKINEVIDYWLVPTASMVYRREILKSVIYQNYLKSRDKFEVGDLPLVLTCASYGKIHCFKEVMSVYRIQSGGWTQQSSLATNLAYKLIIQEIAYMRIFGGYYKKAGPLKIAKHSRAAISLCTQRNLKEALRVWKLAFKFAPWKTIKLNTTFAIRLLKSKV